MSRLKLAYSSEKGRVLTRRQQRKLAEKVKTPSNEGLKLYTSYSFRDKDPVIDVVRTIVQDSGQSLDKIERGSGVTTQTLRRWFQGKTKKPQFATVAAVARQCGADIYIGEHKLMTRGDKIKAGRAKK